MSLPSEVSRELTQRYRKLSVLGEGNSGTTYLAERTKDRVQVALKECSLRACRDWKMLDLFEREVALLKQLDHPAIPRYVDSFICESEGDRHYYLAQTIANGKSLADWIESGWRATEADVIDIAQQLLSILIYLQSLETPVIHRDIKPNNIIRDEQGKIALVDFGAVGHVYQNTFMRGSTVVGTFGYMAPEQFRGKVFPATDLYGVGATLLFLLTRRSPAELSTHQLAVDFRSKVNISSNFANWLEQLLNPDLEIRFSTAQQALTALNRRSISQWMPHFQRKSSPFIVGGVLAFCLASVGIVKQYPYALVSIFAETWMDRALQNGGVSIDDYLAKGGSQSVHSRRAPGLLVAALLQEDYPLAKQMLSAGMNLEKQTASGETPLHIIVQTNREEALDFLLQQRPALNLDAVNSRGMAPIQMAKDESMALKLIDLGVALDTKDNTGVGFFQQAIAHGWSDVVKVYVRQIQQSPESDRTLLKEGKGMIGMAIAAWKYEIAQQLIDTGLRLTEVDFAHIKLSHMPDDFLEKNFDAIADLSALDADGHGLMHLAVAREDIDLLNTLLSRGVSINQPTQTGQTPLEFIVAEGYTHSGRMSQMLVALLRANATASPTALDKANVLHRLVYLPIVKPEEEVELVEALIEKGVSVNYQDEKGNAPLHYTDNVKVSKTLIESGADVNARNKEGYTPLHYARSYAMGKLLIENNADIYNRAKGGATVLPYVSQKNRGELIELYNQIHH